VRYAFEPWKCCNPACIQYCIQTTSLTGSPPLRYDFGRSNAEARAPPSKNRAKNAFIEIVSSKIFVVNDAEQSVELKYLFLSFYEKTTGRK
jgi:hypothetical protein